MTSRTTLPHWSSAALSDIATIIRGVSYKKAQSSNEPFSGSLAILRANNIQDGSVIANDLVYVPADLVKPHQQLLKGDIVVAMSSGSKAVVGKAARIRESFDGSFGAFCGVLRPVPEIIPTYLAWFTHSLDYRNRISSLSAGANINNLKPSHFSEIEIRLAPLAEQKVIADKLDILLAQVDNTKARLERIPQILKRFRQSVLAAAVSGRLTEEWRSTPPVSFQQPPLTIGQEKEEAPMGWKWQDLTALAKLESGHTPRKSRPDYWENGDVPWISLQDIRKAHGKVISKTKFMPNMKGIENSSARLLPKGTVCFSRDISVGFTTIMGREMATTQHFVNWICGPELNNYFLMYAFMAAKDHLTISGQGSTVKTIYMPACKQFRIITPPLEEQTEIVRRVDQLFAHADRIEQQVNNALARVNKLTQSILAKAFRGELTEQWRQDHPDLISGENSAEALLGRIKAERAAAPARRTRKAKRRG